MIYQEGKQVLWKQKKVDLEPSQISKMELFKKKNI